MYSRLPRSRWTIGLLITVTVTLFLSVILAFPFLLRGVAGQDWKTLSDMGQSYGVISTVLSGLALCGVVVSVTFQWRQVMWARTASARERHFELIKLMLAEPDLSYQRREPGRAGSQRWRRRLTCNLWSSHWLLLWDLGELDESSLKIAFDELFADEIARDWWHDVGAFWIGHRTRRRDRFLAIAWKSFRDSAAAPAEGIASPGTADAESAVSSPVGPASVSRTDRHSLSEPEDGLAIQRPLPDQATD
ncbi:hypothetical protein AMIS_46050 [Actinoplanes missouriensis 431]|uniref:Uncharacterized protein n=1 Tax=Actinoplanes missouriensis (strain ATCC 14538 / DSM 43046 / CBS 188.64 / JCM 3121 / NBRC 102363 / NCIMB 12654 / NRRL B-3342 / UNCC 431) TaxID=512565 RepID=I0H9Y8_ACTM4|nr:DUF6082 family protein [Actinoplanes missouriensis]BAL89825.1 hypothetical protein AMIS_46050 [Actinoplanes missouriensis 431]